MEEIIEETDWILIGGIVQMIDLLLGAGGFFGLKFYRKKMLEENEVLAKKLST